MKKFARFITLGCKVNQYETQAMRESLERVGICDFRGNQDTRRNATAEAIDFVIINTCTVTKTADRENIYWIRRAKREHPHAKIIVTGCFTEKNRKEIEAVPGVDLVLGNREKSEIAMRLDESCATAKQQIELSKNGLGHSFPPFQVSRAQGRTRAYIKIQDGCNHACSFCKVVLVRGKSRSRPLQAIVDEANRLRDSGYCEIVLTGIQLGAYGLDFSPRLELSDVLEACSQIDGIKRIRLSAIEPTDVRDSLMETLKAIPSCCPHLHIPLQSGDDEILKRMNRRYTSAFYVDLIERLRSVIPDFLLTLDVMAGFPGEDAQHFQHTLQVLNAARPVKCHVFPYSLREGTRAAQYDNLPPDIVHWRTQQLMALSDQLGHQGRELYLGKVVDVLVEKKTRSGSLLQGLTPNYLRVCFSEGGDKVGEIVQVELKALSGQFFLGEIFQPKLKTFATR